MKQFYTIHPQPFAANHELMPFEISQIRLCRFAFVRGKLVSIESNNILIFVKLEKLREFNSTIIICIPHIYYIHIIYYPGIRVLYCEFSSDFNKTDKIR